MRLRLLPMCRALIASCNLPRTGALFSILVAISVGAGADPGPKNLTLSAAGSATVPAVRNDPPTVTVLTPSASSPVLPDVGEFSRDVVEDPWDFNEITDGMLYHQLYDAGVEGGILSATASGNDPHFWLLFQGYTSAQNIGKNGQHYPIDPARYVLASFRLYLSSPSYLYFYWYAGTDGPGSADFAVSEGIPVQSGWQTYHVRLDEIGIVQSNGLGPWSSCSVINGLRIDPTLIQGSTIKLDWFRLSEAGDASTEAEISWIANDDYSSATIAIYFDVNEMGFNGELMWGPEPIDNGQMQTALVSTAHFPYPGPFVYVEVDDGVNSPTYLYAPARATKNASPLVLVQEPDELGPEEFALEVQGDSWDMESWDDIGQLYNINDPEIIGGMLHGVSATSDPRIHPARTEPINTRRYAAGHIRLWSQYNHVMRMLWVHETPGGEWQTTDDFVLFGAGDVAFQGWNEFRIPDMQDLIMEPSGGIGWTGEIDGHFRLDPNELQNAGFALDFIHFYTHDMSDGDFLISWSLDDPDANVRPIDLSWYWKEAPSHPDSHQITVLSGIAAGEGSYLWDMTSLSSGTYYLYAVADDGLNATKHWARGMLVLNRIPSFSFLSPADDDSVLVGQDFATVELGNEWDMSGPEDIDEINDFDPGSINWEDGTFCGVTSGANPYFQWRPLTQAIAADTYRLFSFRLFLDESVNITIWIADMDWNWTMVGPVEGGEGWRTYIVNLGEVPEWTGDMQIVRIDPGGEADVTVCLDWVRLSVPDSAPFSVVWNAVDPDDEAEISFAVSEESWTEDELLVIGTHPENDGPDSLILDLAPLPVGSYTVVATIDDGINAPVDVISQSTLAIVPLAMESLVLNGELWGVGIIRLAWTEPSGFVDRYRIYRSNDSFFDPAFMQPLGETGGTAYFANLGAAFQNPDLNYFFRVTWVDDSENESPPSNAVGVIDFATGVTP